MLATFLDGPAKDEQLSIDRAPPFLRVAQNGLCLRPVDRLEDEPELTEIVYAYERADLNAEAATYRFCQPQPQERLIAQNHAWRGWTTRIFRERNA